MQHSKIQVTTSYGLNCIPVDVYVEVQLPGPQNLEIRPLKEVIKLK